MISQTLPFVRFVVLLFPSGEFGRPCPALSTDASNRKPLSFHTVSFGPSDQSLRGMVQIAKEVETTVPRNAADAHVESSYNEALDSVCFPIFNVKNVFSSSPQVRLAETFLGIANSLQKTRGALIA